ncbi:MAG: hypothetical protein K2X47_14940, partial [Bdellovibrionales bacterium]|nr:hypothetical protein [Bdellovibrionales bacterium]
AQEERWFERPTLRRSVNRAMNNPQESDSGIRGPKFGVIEAELKQLAKTNPTIAGYVNYGKTAQGRNLSVIRIGLQTRRSTPAPAVLLTGATHGDEYLNIEDQMPRIFLANGRESGTGFNNFLKRGGMIYVVPIFNPDGYDLRRRTNTNGVDLNRDFDVIPTSEKKFTQAETRLFTEFLDKDLKDMNLNLKMSMDYHCCVGAWLHPWGYSKTPLEAPALKIHQDWAKEFIKLFGSEYVYGNTWTVLGYLSHGSSRDFYFAKYGSISYTFEGVFGVENQNLQKHIAMWDAILNYFASTTGFRLR